MGARIQLLRLDTERSGHHRNRHRGPLQDRLRLPGRYSIKVIAESFLPSLRDVRVRAGTVVNLTLNTLLEAMQWLPAKADLNIATATIGPGPCAQPPTGPCCAGSRMGRLWWSPTARRAAEAEGAPDGDGPGRLSAKAANVFRRLLKTPNDSGELLARVDSTQEPTRKWSRCWVCRPGTCRLCAIRGGSSHSSRGSEAARIVGWRKPRFAARRRCGSAELWRPKPGSTLNWSPGSMEPALNR